jgi:hypothetical protein
MSAALAIRNHQNEDGTANWTLDVRIHQNGRQVAALAIKNHQNW